MARLKIVYVPTPDLRGPDLTRIGTIEEIPDELARMMVAGGEAVYADGHEDEPAAQPRSAPVVPVVGVPMKTTDELEAMTKADLVDYADQRQVEVTPNATKADLVAALADDDVDAAADNADDQ